jgi:hypothetical protein
VFNFYSGITFLFFKTAGVFNFYSGIAFLFFKTAVVFNFYSGITFLFLEQLLCLISTLELYFCFYLQKIYTAQYISTSPRESVTPTSSFYDLPHLQKD